MIVKIQRALFPRGNPALITNRDKSMTIESPHTEEVEAVLAGRDKVYAEALIEGEKIVIVRTVEDQPW